jgi:hypothetical protein
MLKCGVLFEVRAEFLNAIWTSLPPFQPAFTRRMSGHCLGTFIAVNLAVSPLSLLSLLFLGLFFKGESGKETK